MDIIFYNNTSENNQIGKNLINSQTLSGDLKNTTDYLHPEIVIEFDPTDYNYIYIEDFKRYYFITEVKAYRNDLWIIKCSVDVLESFKTEILNLNVIIDKQKSLGNQYKDDGSIVMENRRFNTVYNFPYGFNDAGELILITAGANYVIS